MPWDVSTPPRTRPAWVELGVVPGGYGWVFPKGDHANLGVGGWLDEGPRLRFTSSAWRVRTGSTRTA